MNLFELAAKIELDSKGFEQGIKGARSLAVGTAKVFSGTLAGSAKVGAVAIKGMAEVLGGELVLAATGAATALGATTAGVTALTKASVSSYADYEQLVGGVETLFKESADAVLEYADMAYKSTGLSANAYMETVTSFSASLLQSLGGDTAKAADYANTAIIDMADNANKMGTAMESLQFAYQGFAKQNYTINFVSAA